MNAERNRHDTQQGSHRLAAPPPQLVADCPVWAPILDRPRIITEVVTLVLCGLSALIVMVLVAFHGWPPWLLVVAGMLIAWAGDALWTVGEHTVGLVLLRRAAGADHPGRGGTAHLGAPDATHPRRRGGPRRAGDHR